MLPSLVNSKEPAKIPALPVLLYFDVLLKFLGIRSSNFFQSINFQKFFDCFIPSSVVKTGSLGILIF